MIYDRSYMLTRSMVKQRTKKTTRIESENKKLKNKWKNCNHLVDADIKKLLWNRNLQINQMRESIVQKNEKNIYMKLHGISLSISNFEQWTQLF